MDRYFGVRLQSSRSELHYKGSSMPQPELCETETHERSPRLWRFKASCSLSEDVRTTYLWLETSDVLRRGSFDLCPSCVLSV